MQLLWAPWRLAYIKHTGGDEGCIFCAASAEGRDRENLIIHRGVHAFLILNRFPYNAGHLMAVSYRHVATLRDLNAEEIVDLMRLVDRGVQALTDRYRPDGFNIGINMGRAAGGGILDHVHVHVVPRWVGDTNFMPVLSDVKVIPEHLDATYQQLAEALARLPA
ncbi:MAG: HIT domain-containing protein [Armatimonadetes bacterium]|nr:HIT domain-containing protein [Armatimonadota bacterium]